MKELNELELLNEMLIEARKELYQIKISRRIKEKTILRLVTANTQSLRDKMQEQIYVDDSLIESQEKVIEVIQEIIADEEKKEAK